MIHVASTYVVDVLSDSLTKVLQKFCDQELSFHYNQIVQQALLPNSEFNENRNGLNVIIMRLADLFNPNHEISSSLDDLNNALMSLQKSTHVPLLVLITPSQASTVKENNYYLEVENQIKAILEANKNTIFVSSEEIQRAHNHESVFDAFTEKHGHIPYTHKFYESLAMIIARKYSLLLRKPYKVIVLDCDGTLWSGVVEEDGLKGIIIDEEYRAFQQFIVSLFDSGFLICLCSKNSEKSILDVMNNNDKMVLDINKHICSHRVNWLPKSVNIQSLAEELNLGLDSFIFIDDNNIECAEVKAAFPEVLVIELPTFKKEKSFSRLEYLKNIWAFDVQNIGDEDRKRTEFYKQNKLRETLQSESFSYEQFLKNLKIKTSIREASDHDLDRIIQLSQRTNQFNLFPDSVSIIELNERIEKKSGCLVIEVSDKYGDYGLVGVVVYDLGSEELVVKNFFLSCRILGRGVEYAVVQHLVRIGEQHAANRIKLLFAITERNIPAIGFLQYLSKKDSLQGVESLICPLEQLKKITPKLIQHEDKKPKSIRSNKVIAHDYMLDIAKEFLNSKQAKSHTSGKLATIEMSLMELCRQYKLDVKEKNIPLIDLGITSLHCVLIASTIYQRFHIEIIPFELLKPDFTFQKLTQYLLNQLKSNHTVSELVVRDPEVSPLSSTQLRLWEDEQIFPGTSRNNMFTAYEINEPINKEIMMKAFIELIARHDALRFSFYTENEKPFLKLNPLQSINFKLDYFSSDNDADIELYINEFRRKPFFLSQAPLFRAALIKKEKNKSLFLFSVHHMVIPPFLTDIKSRELSRQS